MPRPTVSLRNQLPALCLAVLFNVALIALLLNSIPKQTAPVPLEPETQLVWLPQMEPTHPAKRPQRSAGGSNAITTHVNPYQFYPQSLQQLTPQRGLAMALESCAPENYDKQSEEVRAACGRIQTALAYDKEHFGVNIDFRHGRLWQEELIKRNRPVLAPCMTPGGPDVIYLLTCVYQVLFTGYDSDKAPHY